MQVVVSLASRNGCSTCGIAGGNCKAQESKMGAFVVMQEADRGSETDKGSEVDDGSLQFIFKPHNSLNPSITTVSIAIVIPHRRPISSYVHDSQGRSEGGQRSLTDTSAIKQPLSHSPINAFRKQLLPTLKSLVYVFRTFLKTDKCPLNTHGTRSGRCMSERWAITQGVRPNSQVVRRDHAWSLVRRALLFII